MKKLIALGFLFPVIACFAQQPANRQGVRTVFLSVNVVPMDKAHILRGRDVVVENGRIISISPAGKKKYGKGSLLINAKGKFLLPGIAEMHAHVPPVDDLQAMKDVVKLFALRGVTTIRGMLGHPRHLELRQKISSGEIFGPRLVTSGPSFNGQSVKTAAEAEALVRQQKEAGYDFLKLHPGLSKETFAAMAKTAKALHIPFAGHVSYDVGVWKAIDAGYATIDHLDGFIEAMVPAGMQSEKTNGLFAMFIADQANNDSLPKLLTALRERKVWVVPTQALAERWFAPGKKAEDLRNEPWMKYMATTTLQNWTNSKNNLLANPKYDPAAIERFISLRRKLINECNKNGVGLLLGSDAPQVFNVPGFATHQELQYMVDAGLTPYEALRTGTVNVGTFLDMPGMGMIRVGAPADLMLVSGDPLQDISNTTKIEGVMLNGRWLSKSFIEKELKTLEKSN